MTSLHAEEQPLIGRDVEAQTIANLLADYPLVTLTGPGGVGKTSLAKEVASHLLDRYPGGVFVGELAGTNDEDDVVGLVARQMDADSLDALRLRSSGTPTLVILDNCESALVQSRTIATELIDGRSEIRVLATSRSPLYAGGERLVPVRPLTVADDNQQGAATPAAQLFVRRATEAGANWPHDTQNMQAVNRLTQQLNGLPLAIELAAARSRVLSPSQLVEHLDQQLDLLVRPGREGDRHHSLRRVIAASYEPLEPDAQQFLRRLAVMSAPFDLGLAHAVAGSTSDEIESLDVMSQLVDASLVDVRQGATGETTYLLLDSIRAFGLERLDEHGEHHPTSERYVDAVTAVANDITARAMESFSPEVLGEIRSKFTHLVNAISWCLDHDPSPARTYQMFLNFYGPTGANAEVAELARRIRDTWHEAAPFQAEAWCVMGTSTFLTGDYQAGADLSSEALSHPDATDLARLMSHRTLGYMAALNEDRDAAKRHLDDAVAIATPFSDAFTRELRISRAAVVADPAESPDALEWLADVRQESAAASEWVTVVWAAVTSSYHHMLRGDVAAARRCVDDALSVADRSGLSWAVSTAHRFFASVRAIESGWEAAAPHFGEAFEVTLKAGDVDGIAMALRAGAGAARYSGLDDTAAELWTAIPARPGLPIPPSLFHDLEEELLAELGPPQPIDSDELVATARRLLGGTAQEPGAARAAVATNAPDPAETPAVDPLVRFGRYELDRAMCELRHQGERVPIEPQVYDVLAYLIEHRGSMVSKNELLDEVWGDRFVSESALTSRIAAARRATGDSGKAQKVIRTVHGKGFTFVADVS